MKQKQPDESPERDFAAELSALDHKITEYREERATIAAGLPEAERRRDAAQAVRKTVAAAALTGRDAASQHRRREALAAFGAAVADLEDHHFALDELDTELKRLATERAETVRADALAAKAAAEARIVERRLELHAALETHIAPKLSQILDEYTTMFARLRAAGFPDQTLNTLLKGEESLIYELREHLAQLYENFRTRRKAKARPSRADRSRIFPLPADTDSPPTDTTGDAERAA